jgi:hypothetical protein
MIRRANIHSDLRIGGMGPHETRRLRGKLYYVDNVPLLRRYPRGFGLDEASGRD